jgi:hypothetical protein
MKPIPDRIPWWSSELRFLSTKCDLRSWLILVIVQSWSYRPGRSAHITILLPFLLVNKEPSPLDVWINILISHPGYSAWSFLSRWSKLYMTEFLVSLIRWLTIVLEVKEKYIYTLTFLLVISIVIKFLLCFQVKVELLLSQHAYYNNLLWYRYHLFWCYDSLS